jgi:hypothetical protein
LFELEFSGLNYLSESGYPGFKDFQDVLFSLFDDFWGLIIYLFIYLSESGYPGFEDFQDV